MDINAILESVAGNSVIAGILVWFMIQYQNLVKKLLEMVDENTRAIGAAKDTMHDVRNAVQKCAIANEMITQRDRQ